MSDKDAAEAKRRAEWLHKHKAHKNWVILSVSEIAVIKGELLVLERERDEARAERDSLRIDAQREAEHHDRMVGELEKVYAERDEARAVAYDLAVIASHCLGSHGSALLTETSERIADTLKRWRELKH